MQSDQFANTEINQANDPSQNSIGLGNSENNDDSNAPGSSRGSTKNTGEDGTISNLDSERGNNHVRANQLNYMMNIYDDEEQKEEDGSPVLSKRFLLELFKKEWRRYYRTPELNEKLYLHYKGFSYIRNLDIFTNLKCLYFEGNGCKSMKGLETNTELRSLFIQENIIETIEGLDTLKDLRQINLNDNMINRISGLKHCEQLDTIYLKRNRLGRHEEGDVDSLKGLLERPTLTCVDISDNYLSDPKILDEILVNLPNLAVLYCQGNEFVKKINAYRKTLIARIPSLKYLDDRPVFEEDRRRAEAYARGGIEEEREEIKRIKKEKDDKHWANHEAFLLMVNKAKQERKEREAAEEEEAALKDAKKNSMKEMMAEAKRNKEEQEKVQKDRLEGTYDYSKDDKASEDKFFDELKQKQESRFEEKQSNTEHTEQVDHIELGTKFTQQASDEFAEKFLRENQLNQQSMEKVGAHEGARLHIEEVRDDEAEEEVEDEEPPELEIVDAEELEKAKKEHH
mmetsp:Transcript_10107/g.17068  ORF Transcript_10107/g.17068 Transcript_10107/m.17068 type:complete len:512 (-) Transcript_10107:334-1869(-)